MHRVERAFRNQWGWMDKRETGSSGAWRSCRTELRRALERAEIVEVTVIPGLLPERRALWATLSPWFHMGKVLYGTRPLSTMWVPGTACGSCRWSNVRFYKEEHAYVHYVVTGLLQIIQSKQNPQNCQIPSVPGHVDTPMQTWRAVPFCPWTVLWMLNNLGGLSNSQ